MRPKTDQQGSIFDFFSEQTIGQELRAISDFVEDGNPCDATTTLRMIERQKDIYGQVPCQTSLDGGYASQENLKFAKEMGVQEVAFHKKRSLKEEDMVSSTTLYRKLKAFRAGIEANIASLKNNFNLKRCNWKGLEGFKAFTWSGVSPTTSSPSSGQVDPKPKRRKNKEYWVIVDEVCLKTGS